MQTFTTDKKLKFFKRKLCRYRPYPKHVLNTVRHGSDKNNKQDI